MNTSIRNVFDLAAVGLAETELPDGHLVHVNPKFEELTGYCADELRQMTLSELVVSSQADTSKAGLGCGESDQRFSRRDGSFFWGRVTVIPSANASMAPAAVTLENINKWIDEDRTKDELIATVAHDLRTPVMAVLGSVAVVRSVTNNARITHLLDVIERNAHVQVKLVSDNLDLVQIKSGVLRLALEPVNLVELQHECTADLRYLAESKGIHLVEDLPQSAVVIAADSGRLRRIFLNLINNSLTFTPRGGAIGVSLDCISASARIQIHDTGVGIPSNLLPHIFEKFVRSNSGHSHHAGLGLYIVQNLVKLHGGVVDVSSAGANQGATFTVTLPLTAGAPQEKIA